MATAVQFNGVRDERAICAADRAGSWRGTGPTGSPWSRANRALVMARLHVSMKIMIGLKDLG